jgi:cytochrome c biogenesis protein CcdA
VLSILSPCVLPLVPIVLGAAVAEHRFGPAGLAAGLAASFVTVGLFVATIDFRTGATFFRAAGGALIAGLVLLVPRFHASLATAAGAVASSYAAQPGRLRDPFTPA